MAETATIATLARDLATLRREFQTLKDDYKKRNPGFGRPTCPHCGRSINPDSKSCPSCEKLIST